MQTHKLERTITSMEVAGMVEKDHNNTMKDIRRIIDHLGEVKSYQSYFIESTYVNSQNKELPCFLLTKKGCELYGTRMTGEKGTLFAIEYIERFNEMETTVKQQALPTDPMEILQLTFEAQKQANEKLDNVDTRVTELEENAPLSPGDYGHISRLVNQRVSTVINERRLKLTQKQRSQLYKDLNAEIKAVMRVPSRTQLRQRHYNDTIDFILNWQPSSATIAIVNQLSIEEFTDIA